MHNPLDVHAVAEAQHIAAAKRNIAARERQADLHEQMSTPRGRRIVWSFIGGDAPLLTSFVADAMQMAYREGVRSRGAELLAELLRVCPDLVTTMQQENRK